VCVQLRGGGGADGGGSTSLSVVRRTGLSPLGVWLRCSHELSRCERSCPRLYHATLHASSIWQAGAGGLRAWAPRSATEPSSDTISCLPPLKKRRAGWRETGSC
jgi:hypothetical protein